MNTEEHSTEKDVRAALVEVGPKVNREHQRRTWGCSCGAALGDSIDWQWHLVNSTIRATVEHVLPTGESS